jgi:beta-galactosidase/beta-glucuronidase
MAFEMTAFQPEDKYQLFVQDWRFTETDNINSYQRGFDDSAWRPVSLPHDMGIEKPFDAANPSCQAYLPGGVCWYRKEFKLPRNERTKSYRILFNGAYCNSKVWCNGKLLGERPNGFVSFYYDITDLLEFGRENTNVIAVRLDHSDFADCRWYTGTGINRDVFLVATDPVHVKQWGTYITTPHIDEKSAKAKLEVTVENDSNTSRQLFLENIIYDKNDRVAARERRYITAEPGDNQFNTEFDLRSPILWTIRNPDMYMLETKLLENEEVIDSSYTPFGVRSFDFNADTGFSLNGQSMLIKGVCLHDDAGALGTAVPKKVWARRLELLKKMGANAIRMSHNPHDPYLYELCDKMGFLVMDEAFDEWNGGKRKWIDGWNQTKFDTKGYNAYYEEWAEKDLEAMLLRDRNHPSVIMWSIGNEIDYPNDPFEPGDISLVSEARKLREIVKDYDLTRPVTAACAGPEANVFKDYLDIIGYNYKEKLYASEHERYPYKIFTGSENGRSFEAWKAVKDNPFISSQFIWTGIDYLGEAGQWEKNGQHSRGSRSGLMDLAGFPKTGYYERMAWWATTPFVQLCKMPDGSINCYSNCEDIELYEDDKTLGVFSVPENKTISIKNPTGSSYKAIGKVARVTMAEYTLTTPGEPARIIAICDTKKLMLDGRDIAHVEMYIIDEKGTIVTDNDKLISVSVSGPVNILGIENGDQGDITPYSSREKMTKNGRLLVYLQSETYPSDVTISFETEGLASISLVIDSQMPFNLPIW